MVIKNGYVVRDVISGLEGVVTGLVSYLTGCDQALVQPKVTADAKPSDGRWVDVQRLEVVREDTVTLPMSRIAGSDPAPVGRERSGFDLPPPVR